MHARGWRKCCSAAHGRAALQGGAGAAEAGRAAAPPCIVAQSARARRSAAMSGYPNGPAGGGFYHSSFASVAPPAAGGGAPQPPSAAAAQYYMPPPTDVENEPPLLEELGINVECILAKSRAVLNPFTRYESTFADEADMTGPVAMCLLLGFLLLLQSKVQFGVIYGQATVGCLALYVVFNLMSQRGIDLYRLTSILGYSLLPMVILSFLAVFLPVKRVKLLGLVLGGGCIAWSTSTATKIFVATLSMHDQSCLVAYPLALLYLSFAFITVF
jgi:protein YIPF5/7